MIRKVEEQFNIASSRNVILNNFIKITKKSISGIIFLPFISRLASNLDTSYTTSHYAVNIAKSHEEKDTLAHLVRPCS